MDTVEGLQRERRRSTFSSGWRAFKHLTTLGYPRRFPVVQFPNLPLIVALVAGQGSRYLRGTGHAYVLAVGYLAMTIWAYEELARGNELVPSSPWPGFHVDFGRNASRTDCTSDLMASGRQARTMRGVAEVLRSYGIAGCWSGTDGRTPAERSPSRPYFVQAVVHYTSHPPAGYLRDAFVVSIEPVDRTKNGNTHCQLRGIALAGTKADHQGVSRPPVTSASSRSESRLTERLARLISQKKGPEAVIMAVLSAASVFALLGLPCTPCARSPVLLDRWWP